MYKLAADTISPDNARSPARTWRPLRWLNLLRLSIASVLIAYLHWPLFATPFLPQHPNIFKFSAYTLFGLGILAIYLIEKRRPAYWIQVYTLALLDIIAYTLLMHASGSVGSGLGILLLISIAGTALLAPERGGNFVAAIATLAVLLEQTFTNLYNPLNVNYTQAGLLGASFFATALLTHILGKRVRESEQLATQRGIDLANMAQLNEHVIQMLQAGVIVVDQQHNLRLINQAAWQMLGMPITPPNTQLELAAPELARLLNHWQDNPAIPLPELHNAKSRIAILPRFIRLGQHRNTGTLIYLEDSSSLAQQAQQLKLASLGRLTASIAHEIRNPLGAISHAGQLLAESPALDKGDTRLVEIIRQHSNRVNTIIENILQLSRRDQFKPQELRLKPWLTQFLDDFISANAITANEITMDITPEDTQVVIDASQLQQILWNLCQNGLRYSQNQPGQAKLILRGGQTREQPEPFLDIIDHGPGIPPETAQHIFEPFFTTETKGTGLGLYIARELCECNRARLEYIAVPSGGSCFRITFATNTNSQI